MTKVTKEWLTYGQASELSGLSRTRLWELLRDGSIVGAKDGRRVRVNAASLQHYLESIPWQPKLPGG